MQLLPIFYVISLPPVIQLIYFGLGIIIGLLGMNRIMGFWGLMFCSIIFSPIVGLMVLLVSAPKKNR